MQRPRSIRPAREVVAVVGLYGIYSLVRNLLGDDRVVAERNGRTIVRLERALGVFHERTIQRVLDHEWIMRALNTFYGLAHFVVTAAVLIWLHRRRASYVWWRSVLVATTFLALIGFAVFPLMPPRLLPGTGIFDAMLEHGAPWNYDHGPVSGLSNQFAAMPSLHVAWALWCAAALWVEGRGSTRPTWLFHWAATAYALVTVVAVMATGNHFVLDALGGAAVLGLAAVGAVAVGLERSATVRAVDGRDGAAAAMGTEPAPGAPDRDAEPAPDGEPRRLAQKL